MGLDPLLAEIVACPQDKGPLYYVPESETLYNPRLSRSYHIDDGIPVLLIDEAFQPDDAASLDARIAADELRPTHEPPPPSHTPPVDAATASAPGSASQT